MNDITTVLALVNGMVGGVLLLLPQLAKKAGYILIVPIIIVIGFLSYFSSVLCLRHLCNYRDIDESMYYHFGQRIRYKYFYDIVIILSLTLLLLIYFKLICNQWVGLFSQTPLIPLLNGLGILIFIFWIGKRSKEGIFFSIGIFSIFGYCVFLIWSISTAPKGQNQMQAANPQFIDLADALAQGFALQSFFIPILKMNKSKEKYGKLLLITYIVGTFIHVYVSYMGAYSILNRQPNTDNPRSIEDFFAENNVGTTLLQIIYLVHLYSTYPIFLKIAKEQFFTIFQNQNPEDEKKLKQIMYNGACIFICVVVALADVQAKTLILFNGAIIGFFQIYFIPVLLHVKCLYFTKHQDRLKMQTARIQQKTKRERELKQKQKQKKFEEPKSGDSLKKNNMDKDPFEEVDEKDSDKKKQKEQQKSEKEQIEQQIKGEQIGSQKQLCQAIQKEDERDICNIRCYSKAHQACQNFIMVLMIIVGLSTVAYTLYALFEY